MARALKRLERERRNDRDHQRDAPPRTPPGTSPTRPRRAGPSTNAPAMKSGGMNANSQCRPTFLTAESTKKNAIGTAAHAASSATAGSRIDSRSRLRPRERSKSSSGPATYTSSARKRSGRYQAKPASCVPVVDVEHQVRPAVLVVPREVHQPERHRARDHDRELAPGSGLAADRRDVDDVGESDQHGEVLREEREPERDPGHRAQRERPAPYGQGVRRHRREREEDERRVGGDEDVQHLDRREQPGERRPVAERVRVRAAARKLGHDRAHPDRDQRRREDLPAGGAIPASARPRAARRGTSRPSADGRRRRAPAPRPSRRRTPRPR